MIKIGIISGSFDLLHFGHIEYLNEASSRFDIVVPIINSGMWVNSWKSRENYLPESEIQKGLSKAYSNFRFLPYFLHGPMNRSVSDTLESLVKQLRMKDFNDITFFKMKDRGSGNCPEEKTCHKLGIKFEHLQGKVEQHTNQLYKDFSNRVLETRLKAWQEFEKEKSSSLR